MHLKFDNYPLVRRIVPVIFTGKVPLPLRRFWYLLVRSGTSGIRRSGTSGTIWFVLVNNALGLPVLRGTSGSSR